MSNEAKPAPMELNGIRLRPEAWRKIERLAKANKKKDRSEWLREQIEALLSRTPDLHDMDAAVHDVSETGEAQSGGAW